MRGKRNEIEFETNFVGVSHGGEDEEKDFIRD
jgi:hypothetical protein